MTDTAKIRQLYNHERFQPGALIGHAVIDTVYALCDELDAARQVLLFADGLAVANTGYALSDLYAEDYRPAQDALKAAGCHERGKIAAGRQVPSKPPACFCGGLLAGRDVIHRSGECVRL